jgi:hypothetical protein
MEIIFRVKSREELEEEELAKVSKFKALPLNKKVRTLVFCSCHLVEMKPV